MARKQLTRTRGPLFPEHPPGEHQWRLDRARRIIMEDGLDALLLARNLDVFYMTGTRLVFVGMEAPMAFVPQATAIVTQDADIYCQRFGPFDTDSVSLETTLSAQIELYDDEMELVNILKDYGIGRGARIGTEWGKGMCVDMNPLKFTRLKQRLEDELSVEVVDATTTFWKMTGIRSKIEIERMKVAVAAAARAMERVYDTIKIGMDATEVSRMVSTFMLEEGGEKVTHAQVMADAADGLRFRSCDALHKPIEVGWVRLDLGCQYKRYGSDINRAILLGRQPTAEEMKLYDCRRGANAVLDRTIKPGVSIDYALEQLKQYVDSQGCMLKQVGGNIFAGHGIGMEPYQHPNLVPASAQPEFRNKDGVVLFEPGMMFTYEMAIELPDPKSTAIFNIEDDVVVTETGVENMNAMLSRDPRIIL